MDLLSWWLKAVNLDVSDEIGAVEQIELFRCNECGLGFFDPELAGSALLYRHLEQFDWYYMPWKWEHERALQILGAVRRVLEVGCGRGEFLEVLASRTGASVRGIDLNPEAAQEARRRGIPVENCDVFALQDNTSACFDAICAFQVLEHLPDPCGFLLAAHRLLRSGGRLIVSTPDSGGFAGRDREAPLNLPPHHVTLWSEDVFRRLPEEFGFSLARIEHESLADYHIGWYTAVQARRIPEMLFAGRILRGATYRFLPLMLHPAVVRRLLRGHTVLAEFLKVDRAGEALPLARVDHVR